MKTGKEIINESINNPELSGEMISNSSYIHEACSIGYRSLSLHGVLFREGSVSLIAGRPSMGKTGFALNLTRNAISTGIKVCYMSLDLSSPKLVDWLIKLGADEDSLANLYIDDSLYSSMSVRKMADKICRECSDARLIIIDSIKALGLDAVQWLKGYFPHAATILLSGVGRDCEYREDHRVRITDIDCIEMLDPYLDSILTLYREDYYRDGYDEERSNLMEVSILKGSEGRAPGIVTMNIEGTFKITERVFECREEDPLVCFNEEQKDGLLRDNDHCGDNRLIRSVLRILGIY